jgi:hypothetical protein
MSRASFEAKATALRCYMMANLRLVLAAEVARGNQHTSKQSSPRLWTLLDGSPDARCAVRR